MLYNPILILKKETLFIEYWNREHPVLDLLDSSQSIESLTKDLNSWYKESKLIEVHESQIDKFKRIAIEKITVWDVLDDLSENILKDGIELKEGTVEIKLTCDKSKCICLPDTCQCNVAYAFLKE